MRNFISFTKRLDTGPNNKEWAKACEYSHTAFNVVQPKATERSRTAFNVAQPKASEHSRGAAYLFLLLLIFSCPSSLTAQTTVNYTADSTMSDAMVANGGVENSNFGSQNQIDVYHLVGQQIPMVFRTFIQYDLSAIPENAIITEAKLKLVTKTVNNSINHPIYIERVENTSWSEGTITWNNQPDVITADQLAFSHAQTSASGTHEFDVTSHVQHMVNNPSLNNGWRIRLQQETASADFGIMYNSSEAGNAAKRPVLTIEYILPIEMDPSVVHCTAGNNDGSFSVDISGGSTYALSNMYFYKTNRDLSQRGKATLQNYKTTGNLAYDAVTGTVTASNLEPGIYILRILDAEYYANSDLRFAFYKHILVGREGETTSGILLPNYQYQENVAIQYDKPTNANPLDRANTNYHSNASLIHLRVADAPNNYEYASLIKYNMDFDDQLLFSKAELQINAYSKFYRNTNSSNAVNFSLVTEDWEESSVTWNTRPAIDSSTTVNVPTTTTIGYEQTHKYDTVSIMPFVDHWLANPDENFGFEIALETYGATQYAQRTYKSAGNNINYIQFDFTVKEAVMATYDDETEFGEIIVNAPSGHPSPYKYLISYKPLPTLSTIWNNVKDSLPTSIDSVTFFAGDVVANSFTFEKLDAEHYYVGVYDNNGTKILDGDAIVAPELALLDASNIDLTDGVLSKGASQSNGSALIDGLLLPEQNGGFEFEVTELGGNMVIGFNNQSDTKPATTADFEYSFELFADNSFDVLKSGTILFEGTVNLGDVFRIYKQNDEIIWYLNEYELTRSTMASNEQVSIIGAVLTRTPLGKIESTIKLDHFKPNIKPVTTIPFNIECGDQDGLVRAAPSTPEYYGGTGTYSIIDLATDLPVASGSVSDLWVVGVSLPAGEYKITYSYTVGASTYNFSTYFSIGFKIFWNVLNDDFVEVDGTTNTIKGSGSLDEGLAVSQNNLGYPQEGWAYVHVNLTKYYVPWGDPVPFAPSKARIQMVNQEIETQIQVNVFQLGDGIINKYIWVTGEEADAFTTYKDGPIKINRVDTDPAAETYAWEYEASFNNNPAPFSTVSEPGSGEDQTFYVFAKGTNVEVYESYASFCGYESIRSYADLTKKLDGGYYLAQNGIVKFIYNEEYNDQDGGLTYSIYDASNTEVVSEGDLAQSVVFGDNRYDLDFSSFTGDLVLENGVYVLEVTNEKSEKWYLRFKIINN